MQADIKIRAGQPGLTLKEARGWFAAGTGCRKASSLLSDGAFKLFFHLCLEPDRRSGTLQATHKELAAALKKSKRAIGTYAAELESKGICSVQRAVNQFAATTFTITDSYWPYHRFDTCSDSPEETAYVSSVRKWFLSLGCVSGRFDAADVEITQQMRKRGIPLALIQDAMLLGACRKYGSWLQGKALEPILSLRYFEALIAEIQNQPLSPGYSGYLRKKVRHLSDMWNQSVKSGTGPHGR